MGFYTLRRATEGTVSNCIPTELQLPDLPDNLAHEYRYTVYKHPYTCLLYNVLRHHMFQTSKVMYRIRFS